MPALQVQELERRREVELTAHSETMAFLERKRGALLDDLDSWEERYAREHAELQRQHEALAAARGATLVRLEALKTRRTAELELETKRASDKAELERVTRAAKELAAHQNSAAFRIQRLFKAYLRLAKERAKLKKGKKEKKASKKKKK